MTRDKRIRRPREPGFEDRQRFLSRFRSWCGMFENIQVEHPVFDFFCQFSALETACHVSLQWKCDDREIINYKHYNNNNQYFL